MAAPRLDSRQSKDLLDQATALAQLYVPKWSGIGDASDPGRQVVDTFVRLMELLIERENRVPEKNFIRFLDLVGVEQFPGSPAQVPITFLLARTATGGAVVPRRTRVATTQTQLNVAQVFETTSEFFATPSRLLHATNLVPGVEGYAPLKLADLPPKLADLKDSSRATLALSVNPDLVPVPHILYLASDALFGRKETVDVTLVFSIAAGDGTTLSPANLKWKRFDPRTKAWVDLSAVALPAVPGQVQIKLQGLAGIAKTTVHGREAFFIAGHLDGLNARNLAWPVVSNIAGFPQAPGSTAGVAPEFAFADAAPLDLSKPALPFGERPRYGAALYLGSLTAFSPEVSDVTLDITILARSNTQLAKQFAGINTATTITTDVEWQYLREDGSWKSIGTFRHAITATPGAPPTITKSKSILSGAGNLQEINGSGALFGNPTVDGAHDVAIKLALNPDIGLQTVNGQKAYWIRAILRSQEPYGTDGFIIPGSSAAGAVTPPTFVGPLFVPPMIESLTVTHTHRNVPLPVDAVLAENNFRIIDAAPAPALPSSFRPFIPLSEHVAEGASGVVSRDPALYFGLDQALKNAFASLFVHLHEPASLAVAPFESGDPHVTWEYLAEGAVWRPLAVQDGTRDLTTSGTVGFLAPSDPIRLKLFELPASKELQALGSSLFWLRARLAGGTYDHPPRILGVYLNTVMAENRTTYSDDVLVGSGNGRPGQTIDLVQTKILEAELWVREPERPNDVELEQLRHEIEAARQLEDPNARLDARELVEVRQPGEADESIWVRWHLVPNFLSSKPRSRHFTLDRVTGILRFGDDKHGLIPPIGRDNLVFRSLSTGGGEEANRVATPLAVKELKTSLSFVDKVFNMVQAAGGAAAWSRQDTLEFGPQSIKNRGRAITTEDYEWMVRERFGQIAKVRCLAIRAPGPAQTLVFRPGAVTVIVVPKGAEALPQPPTGLLRAIQEFLQEKTLGAIVQEVHVIGPSYQVVPITARLAAVSVREASLITREAAAALEAWLHPLSGGDDGLGWEFGRDVYLSEVYAVLSRVPGVDHVEFAEFSGRPGVSAITIEENSLTATGTHQITIH